MTPRRFKYSQVREGTLDFNFEQIKLLQNDFCKQRLIILNAAISGQYKIYPKAHLCRTFAEYIQACIKVGCKGVYITRTCYPDGNDFQYQATGRTTHKIPP